MRARLENLETYFFCTTGGSESCHALYRLTSSKKARGESPHAAGLSECRFLHPDNFPNLCRHVRYKGALALAGSNFSGSHPVGNIARRTVSIVAVVVSQRRAFRSPCGTQGLDVFFAMRLRENHTYLTFDQGSNVYLFRFGVCMCSGPTPYIAITKRYILNPKPYILSPKLNTRDCAAHTRQLPLTSC